MTATQAQESPSRVYMTLLAIGSLSLLVMPFLTTFDDFLTSLVKGSGVDAALQQVVPEEARMVAVLLSVLGVHVAAYSSQLVVSSANQNPQVLYISWNCIGWQSAVLFGLSLFTGLRAPASPSARIQVILLGAFGTFFVNLIRITIVCLLAAWYGRVPAVLFHDYGGTVLVLGWLFVFWAASYRWLLVEPPAERALA